MLLSNNKNEIQLFSIMFSKTVFYHFLNKSIKTIFKNWIKLKRQVNTYLKTNYCNKNILYFRIIALLS